MDNNESKTCGTCKHWEPARGSSGRACPSQRGECRWPMPWPKALPSSMYSNFYEPEQPTRHGTFKDAGYNCLCWEKKEWKK